MYNVTVTNHYHDQIKLDSPQANAVSHLIGPGWSKTFENWGSHILYVPGMGPINFIDLKDKKLPQFTSKKIPWTEQTWGGLIRYRGLDAYFRYEESTTVQAIIDHHGSLDLMFEKGGMIVNLPDMTISQSQ